MDSFSWKGEVPRQRVSACFVRQPNPICSISIIGTYLPRYLGEAGSKGRERRALITADLMTYQFYQSPIRDTTSVERRLTVLC